MPPTSLVNWKTVFWSNKFKNHFFHGILKIKQFCLSSSSKTFWKMHGKNNILEGTNILRSYTYIFVLCNFFSKITDCHWLINVRILFMYGIWKIIQLNISRASQIVQKLLGELKSQGELIFWEPLDIGSPLGFSVNETLLFQNNKCQSHSLVRDVGNQTISFKQ